MQEYIARTLLDHDGDDEQALFQKYLELKKQYNNEFNSEKEEKFKNETRSRFIDWANEVKEKQNEQIN